MPSDTNNLRLTYGVTEMVGQCRVTQHCHLLPFLFYSNADNFIAECEVPLQLTHCSKEGNGVAVSGRILFVLGKYGILVSSQVLPAVSPQGNCSLTFLTYTKTSLHIHFKLSHTVNS